MRDPKNSEVGRTPPGCQPLGQSQKLGASSQQLGQSLIELQPRMASVALRFAPDRDAANDIVQNAFEKAVRNLAQFRGQARFSTWLHRIVVNESLMWLRSEKRRGRRQLDVDDWDEAEWVEPAPDPCQNLTARERQRKLRQGIASLPHPERDVLLRCGLEQVSYEQFSAETGIRPAAAKSRAFRGRQRLRELLAEV